MESPGKRGRRSAESLSVVRALPSRMLEPPGDLTTDEAAIFARVAATKPGEWWDAGSVPLLAAYARASVQSVAVAELVRVSSKMLVTDPDELARYKELRKIQSVLTAEMNSLARAMRLTQQSRYRADKADTTARKVSGARPWQTGEVIEG